LEPDDVILYGKGALQVDEVKALKMGRLPWIIWVPNGITTVLIRGGSRVESEKGDVMT
jgi:hypothetical protein